jgi:hypothetical protein
MYGVRLRVELNTVTNFYNYTIVQLIKYLHVYSDGSIVDSVIYSWTHNRKFDIDFELHILNDLW